MGRLFRFKQFSLSDEGSAMKIGTDAVMLGAWTDCRQARRIMDIGTGCGILALMLAQPSEAEISAIEPEESAFLQAQQNFQSSPWTQRLHVFQSRIQDFIAAVSPGFDLIVCNPPFFRNSLLSPDEGRRLARHDNDLSQYDLLKAVTALGSDDVRFSLVLPANQEAEFETSAISFGLYCSRKLRVRTYQDSEVVRVLMEFRKQPCDSVVENLILREADGAYSLEYQRLTRDYHPHF